MHRFLRFAAALATTLAVSSAPAHTVDKGLAAISVEGQLIHYRLQLSVSAIASQGAVEIVPQASGTRLDYSALLWAVPEKITISSNGKACAPGDSSLTPPPQEGALVTLELRFTCAESPRTLEVQDNLPDVLGTQYHTIANVQWHGGSQPFVFMTQARDLRIEVAEANSPRSAGSFFVLGIEHILTGYDHLLFLLALILRGGNLWSLLKIVTAFTVAHSITLALAALDIVTLPEVLVEATIALSIAYVAAENLFMRKAVSHRWAVSFVFGLVHGFGFSNVLREVGLPSEGLVWSLLSFNLGVEAGQAMAVLLALPILLTMRKRESEPRAVMATSVVILTVGIALFVDRAVS